MESEVRISANLRKMILGFTFFVSITFLLTMTFLSWIPQIPSDRIHVFVNWVVRLATLLLDYLAITIILQLFRAKPITPIISEESKQNPEAAE